MDQNLVACHDQRIARAIRTALNDLQVRPSRAVVARAANLEPTYFSRRFRKVVGISFALWNKSVRVDVARKLLTTTDRKVRDVAAAVGYADVTTFERVFRKIAGVSPKKYRMEGRVASTSTPDAD